MVCGTACLLMIAQGPAMRDSPDRWTKFVPQPRGTSLLDRATPGLPPDLVNRAAARLQISAWLYAFTFFMAAFFPRLIFADERRILFPEAGELGAGQHVDCARCVGGAAIRRGHLRPAAITALALVFRSRRQLWHCGSRISSAGLAQCAFALGRSVLGRCYSC